jgi:hypothetical protein
MNLDLKTLAPIVAALFVGVGAGGGGSYFVTRGESDCRADLAGAKARIELQAEAMTACSRALDAVTGAKPAPAEPATLDVLPGCAYAGQPTPAPVAEPCPVCEPCPCAAAAALDAVEKARKALDAAAKK